MNPTVNIKRYSIKRGLNDAKIDFLLVNPEINSKRPEYPARVKLKLKMLTYNASVSNDEQTNTNNKIIRCVNIKYGIRTIKGKAKISDRLIC